MRGAPLDDVFLEVKLILEDDGGRRTGCAPSSFRNIDCSGLRASGLSAAIMRSGGLTHPEPAKCQGQHMSTPTAEATRPTP